MKMITIILILLVAASVVLILGFALLAAYLWEWIGIVQERRAVERCLRLHATDPRKTSHDLW